MLSPLKAVQAAGGTASTAQTYDIIRLTLAMYNAAPGSINVSYLAGYLAQGISMTELSNLLAQTDAFKSPLLYPPTLSSQQFAARFVDNLVDTTVDYHNKALLADVIVKHLDNGLSRGEVIRLVASGLAQVSTTDPVWGKAATQFANRVEVAYYYSVTTAQWAQDLGTLQAVVKYVTDDPGTVATAKAQKPVNLAPSWASLGISGASRQIAVSWTPNSTAATSTTGLYYNLYWSKKPGVTKKNGTRITNVTSPYIHTGLANGAMYYYVVTEVTGGIEGPESHEIATAPKAVIPVVPTGISVAPAHGAVQVSLDPASTIATTRFNLYYSTDVSLSNLVKLANAFGNATSFRHAPLQNGASYYYVITAGESDGESPSSSPVSAQPLADIKAVDYIKDVTPAQIAAPNNVTGLAGDQLVNLSWNMPASQIPLVFDPDLTPTQPPVISAFNIYWSTDVITDLAKANKFTLPVVLPAALPMTYTHNDGLVNKTPYHYIITAVADTDANGIPLKTAKGVAVSFESPASSQISVVPEAKAPAAPTGLSATAGAQKITLIWTPSITTGASYRLYMSKTAPLQPEDLINPANLLAITTTPSYLHTGLQNGITYYYVVTAVTAGESTPSAIVAVSLR